MSRGHDTENQKMIGFWCEREFLELINRERGPLSLSQYIRQALLEKLKAVGVSVDPEIAMAPDRAGKGGRKAKPKAIVRYPEGGHAHQVINELTPAQLAQVRAVVEATIPLAISAAKSSAQTDGPVRGKRRPKPSFEGGKK